MTVSGWRCANCGQLDGDGIALYREGDMFNARSRRFDPRCVVCGGHATFSAGEAGLALESSRGRALVISGTCSSGKTTISHMLAVRHGFVQVDGDWIQERLRDKDGRRADLDEIHDYLLNVAEGLVAIGRSVAIAHIILPPHLPRYRRFFRERGIGHRIVTLMPRMPVLLLRNADRVCWPKATPEYWVRRFHEDLLSAPGEPASLCYDNSDESPEETADRLRAMLGD